MAEKAAVESVDGIKLFRIGLIKFAATAGVALADAEAEVSRTLMWLENEARSHWDGQLRKRHELVERCKESVRMKKLFKDSAGRQQSAIDEEKALATAQRALAEAMEKANNVKKYTRVLQKELQMYKGGVTRLSTDVSSVLPQGALELGAIVEALEAYSDLQMPESSGTPQSVGSTGPMTRAVDEEATKPAPPPAATAETRNANDE